MLVWKNFFLAGGRPLHRLMIHSSAVSLSKFRMLSRWYRVGSALLSLRRHFASLSQLSFASFPIYQHNPRSVYSVPSGNDALRFYDMACVAEVLVRPLVPTRHCKPLKRIITCAVVSFNVVVSADSTSRITPHVQKDFFFALCLLQTVHRIISSMTMSSVRSVFPCSLYNSVVRAFNSVPFSEY